SLVGSNPGDGNVAILNNPGDLVGFFVKTLSNGNYVVDSPLWNGNRGAATCGNGSTGVTGIVSEANSLVGGNPGDYAGAVVTHPYYFLLTSEVITLSNGNYVIASPHWSGNRGAVTWGNGSTGVSGTVSEA